MERKNNLSEPTLCNPGLNRILIRYGSMPSDITHTSETFFCIGFLK